MPKLLIVANKFFPDPSVAAVRITEWCRGLPDLGWEPLVATIDHGYASDAVEPPHPRVAVTYIRRWPPGLLKSATMRLAYRKLVAPDLQLLLWRSYGKKLRAIARDFVPDAILTSSPPHAIHAAGASLAEDSGRPWVADFRDPYLFDDRFRPRGPARFLLGSHESFERRIYDRAALIVHAIPSHARWAQERYPRARDRIVFIPNGAPARLFDAAPRPARIGRRRITAVGSCGDREAVEIAVAIRALIDAGADLELRLVGAPPRSEPALRKLLGDRVVLTGALGHARALDETADADVLVAPLSVERSSYKAVSSKLFEYLAAAKPVIVVNPTESDRELFGGAPALTMLDRPRGDDLRAALTHALETKTPELEAQRLFVKQRFRRDEQTALLAGLLDKVIHRR